MLSSIRAAFNDEKEIYSMTNFDAQRQEFLRTSEAFRLLHQEHHECEERLTQIAQHTLPSEEDEAEEKRLKIHKLALKDRMEAMMRDHQETRVTV
ncbi:MAG: YdcH family protein [Thermoanaerobaculia bacterium]